MTTKFWQQKKYLLILVPVVIFILFIVGLIAYKNASFSTNTNHHKTMIVNISTILNHIDYGQISSSSSVPAATIQTEIINEDDKRTKLINLDIIECPKPDWAHKSIENLTYQCVIPVKTHNKPLHEDDLLYESKKPDAEPNKNGMSDSQTTGQFRNKSSLIWDPHPEYTVKAFGREMYLELNQHQNFVSKDLKVTHLWKNSTLRLKKEHEDNEAIKGCYYNGIVRGDPQSSVTVSLCNGMQGHIFTTTGSYVIEPIENYTEDNQNIVHRIIKGNLNPRRVLSGQEELGDNLIEDIKPTVETVKMHSIKCENDVQFGDSCSHTTDEDFSRIGEVETIVLDDNKSHHNRHRRSTDHLESDNEYTMEVLVAVDRKMQQYHGNDIKKYVLTLMSTVSRIYADASIGNSINVAVVHIVLLQDDLGVSSNDIGVSAAQMLNRFCRYISHGFHHDTALLLTREQICRSANQTKCDTLGLAELGTMCKPSSCAIVQDNGLSAAFTIAHELGHVLNVPHDDDVKCEPYRRNGVKSLNIMSRMLDHNTHPWSWSECSRHFVTEYLEHDNGNCMRNKPQHVMIEPPSHNQLLAGEKFTSDQQCQLVFGPYSKICTYMPPCIRLWCSVDEFEIEGCSTQHMPWADGTTCAEGKWCQRGICVDRDRRALMKVDGRWGPWSSFSECSRTCGGGIQSATRECNSPTPENGGKYCVGQRIQYRSCNNQLCPDKDLDFREQQCAEWNDNNFGISGLPPDVKWVPKYGVSHGDECKLYCRVDKTNNYFLLRPKVKDGTTCTHDGFNKCVNGICRPAGCDNKLDSTASLDKCGVCQGNNDTCIETHGSVTVGQIEDKKKSNRPKNNIHYIHIIQIPRGASNIEITQPGHSNDHNYIALMNDQGQYLLNGYNTIVQYQKQFAYGGITFDYTGVNTTMERVTTMYAKRIQRDLIVEILSVQKMHAHLTDELISYKYTVALNDPTIRFHPHHSIKYSTQTSHTPKSTHPSHHSGHSYGNTHQPHLSYKWELSEWSECSQICFGQRYRTAICIESSHGKKVATSYCDASQKLTDEYQACNAECSLEWETKKSKCSAVCGEGVRSIEYVCIQRYPTYANTIDKTYCSSIKKPNAKMERCMGSCEQAVWNYSQWSPCSKSCNGGVRSRNVTCLSHRQSGFKIDDNYCSHLNKESLTSVCNTEACPTWTYGDDSKCSVTCGEGEKIKSIHCMKDGRIVTPYLCDVFTRPKEIREKCSMPRCYSVKPISNSVYAVSGAPDSDVKVIYRPADPTGIAPSFEWKSELWSSCSVACGGGGVKQRVVRCVLINEKKHEQVDDKYCEHIEKPLNITSCGHLRCPEWSYGNYGQCDDNCMRHRLVICRDHRGTHVDDQCPEELKPVSSEPCCQFKWRNVLGHCIGTPCSQGYKKRETKCKKLPIKGKSDSNLKQRGEEVDVSYCNKLNLRKPTVKNYQKSCEVPCDIAKWTAEPWSKCNVGCGQGQSTRIVRCKRGNTIVNDSKCNPYTKPIRSQMCETRTHCSWKAKKWKNCTCSGITKRKVNCYDTLLNRVATGCNEMDKLQQRAQCVPPQDCSCRGLQQMGHRSDGDYDLNIRGRRVKIYCHNMKTNFPQEFLTVNEQTNYASYYHKRARDSSQCPTHTRDGEFDDKTIPHGITYFSKLRLHVQRLQVQENDFTFARTSGKRQQNYGSAGDCYSITKQCPQGSFSIDLNGTQFKIKNRTKWELSGYNATIRFTHELSPPYKTVMAACGGYCASCSISKNTTLQLEIG